MKYNFKIELKAVPAEATKDTIRDSLKTQLDNWIGTAWSDNYSMEIVAYLEDSDSESYYEEKSE